jgi:ribosomal protein S27AE
MPLNSELCPNCGAAGVKSWSELTGDEKLLAERLPASAEYTAEERKKHRFCTRCWYEKVEKTTDMA